MTYTPPPPAPPPPRAVQPAGKDNTTLFGWIGIIIIFGVITAIGWPSIWYNR